LRGPSTEHVGRSEDFHEGVGVGIETAIHIHESFLHEACEALPTIDPQREAYEEAYEHGYESGYAGAIEEYDSVLRLEREELDRRALTIADLRIEKECLKTDLAALRAALARACDAAEWFEDYQKDGGYTYYRWQDDLKKHRAAIAAGREALK